MVEGADKVRLVIHVGKGADGFESYMVRGIGEDPADVTKVRSVEEVARVLFEPDSDSANAFRTDIGIQVTIAVYEHAADR